ncbi:MAG: hypothetical protein V3573_00045 [Desulfovibrionaceae bacterium]
METRLKSMNVADASKEAVRVMMFEQWLRFYFLQEQDGVLRVHIPDENLEKIGKQQAELLPLAEMLNGEEITYEKCQTMVCSFLATFLDGKHYASEVLPKAFDSKGFKVDMYMFQVWNKGHESYLDERFHDFEEWEEMIREWSKLEEVVTYRKKLVLGGSQTPGSGTSTVQ